MRSLRLAIRCILILCVAFGFPSLTRPALADGGERFLVPTMPSGAGAITLDSSDADWPASARLCPPALACSLTPIGVGAPTGTVRMMIKDSDDPMVDNELHVFITVVDGTPDTVEPIVDDVILMFDLSHDHTVASTVSFDASDDRGVRFKRNNTAVRVFGNLNAPSDGPAPADGFTGRVVVTANVVFGMDQGWTVEARLLPSDLGLNSFNALLGASLIATDRTANKKAKWPSSVVLTDPMTWANLITRLPIDYALLVDQSGSMGGVKWDSARRAADNFAVVLSKLKDSALDAEYAALAPALPADRLGLANFTWNSGPSDSTIVAPLAAIPASPPMAGYATSLLPASPGGWTPIAEGINKTVLMFTGGVVPNAEAAMAATTRTRVVMLLTDGQHNRPNPTINYSLTSAGGDFTYVPAACTANSLVRVNPIAIGSDATVDPMTLDDIKSCFSGKAFTQPGSMALNYYNIAGTTVGTGGQLTAQLTRHFVETMTPYYNWNFIDDTDGSVASFSIRAGERKLLLLAFWDNAGDAVALTITKPDMSVATGTADTNLGISTLLINNPPAGNYTNFTAAGATRKMVLLDLRTEALFAIDNQPHGTGSTISLQGKLRDDGRPVTGADVRVDIARPEEGFGTYVSTHDPSNCNQAQPPQLPPADKVLQLFPANKSPAHAGIAPPPDSFVVVPGGNLVAPTGGPDASAPHFNRMQQLLTQCGKAGLNRAEDTGLKLFDDATHGDATAGDGIYTLRFENTQYEGSYIFRFRANGTTPDGTPFRRVREVGQFVRVDVDPPSSPISSRDLQQSGTIVTSEFYIIPRDRFGGYLGPGHADLVDFNTTAGTFISPVIDYNNGIYSQVLSFDRATDDPVVTGTVDGEPMPPAKGASGQQGFEFFPYVGGFFFQNALGLDNGPVVGARLGYRFPNQFALEGEGGVTFSRFNFLLGTSPRVLLVQVLGNVRYDVEQWGTSNWTPYFSAGAGGIFARSLFNDDEAFAVHAGLGSTFKLTNHVGFRTDGRVFRLGQLYGRPSTTAFQLNLGLVFRF